MMVTLIYTTEHTTFDGYPALFALVNDARTGQPLPTIEIVWIDGQQTYRDVDMTPIPAASLADAIRQQIGA
ncbi:MAG: hypothetical protein IT335_00675 [Thermomicrobiales bacterium]|nr:hypothetical protein [Thermomicrobiales bacterium]